VLRFFGLDDFGRGLAGHEFCAAAFGEVAGELGVPIILELLDLVRRPALRHANERVGDRALGKIIELPELAAQRDVDDTNRRWAIGFNFDFYSLLFPKPRYILSFQDDLSWLFYRPVKIFFSCQLLDGRSVFAKCLYTALVRHVVGSEVVR
jgi:hypothetical protein